MPITRTAMIDDDGSGTTGTVLNNAWKQELYGQIDAFVGPWIDVAFNAANFTASSGGTWTVTAPSVGRYSYAIVGTTLLVQVYITGTTIGGSPSSINLQLPAAIKNWQGGSFATNIGSGTGVVLQQGAGIILTLYRDILGTPWPAGTIHGPVGSFAFQLA